jgi:hypothetical protein
MWKVKTKVIPVILYRQLEKTASSFRKYLSDIPGKHKIKELQKKPYWALYTHFKKYKYESTKHLTWEITIHLA